MAAANLTEVPHSTHHDSNKNHDPPVCSSLSALLPDIGTSTTIYPDTERGILMGPFFHLPQQPTTSSAICTPTFLKSTHFFLYQPPTPVQMATTSLLKNSYAFLTGQPHSPLSTILQGDFFKYKLCHCPDESPEVTPTSLRTRMNNCRAHPLLSTPASTWPTGHPAAPS